MGIRAHTSHQTNNLGQPAKLLAQRQGNTKFVTEKEGDKYLLFPQNQLHSEEETLFLLTQHPFIKGELDHHTEKSITDRT